MIYRDAHEPDAPPHRHLAKVVWVASIGPQPCTILTHAGYRDAVQVEAQDKMNTSADMQQSTHPPVLMNLPLFSGLFLNAVFWRSAVNSQIKPVTQMTPPTMSDHLKPVLLLVPFSMSTGSKVTHTHRA